MLCPRCAAQLPDQASFRWQCGLAQTPGRETAEETWETCQITYRVQPSSGWWPAGWCIFWAEASGPRGSYAAGEAARGVSAGDVYAGRPSARQAHAGLLEALIKAGWEPLEQQSPLWWNTRLRRRIG